MTKKVPSIFPIEQDPACLLKWGWSTIFLNSGTTASCHRTQKYPIDPNNFDLFHNVPDKRAARKLMLNGQWPGHGCQYCKNIEMHGNESDRMLHLKSMTNLDLVPPEVRADPNSVYATPTFLEVYFSNICNMKCIYCGPHFSSSWEDENRKFNHWFEEPSENLYNEKLPQHNPQYKKMVADLWQYLETDQRYLVLRRFNIAGGEPFLLSELDQCIDFWDSHPNPDLTVSIISNLNIPHERFLKYINEFRNLINTGKIMTLQITASLDMWGVEQEYIRYGLDLKLWQKNFESIVQDPIITCSINSALSALAIKKFSDLIEKINYWNALRAPNAIDEHNRYIIHSFNYVGSVFNPFYFSGDVFEEDFKKILNLLPTDSHIQRRQKETMEGIANTHRTHNNNIEKINEIKKRLDILDTRRNTNWRDTFPWLNKDFNL